MDGYTSKRKNRSTNNSNDVASSSSASDNSRAASTLRRRLQEADTETNDNAEETNNGKATLAKAALNHSPTIQQLKGTIVKDDMNRGPPLDSEFLVCRSSFSVVSLLMDRAVAIPTQTYVSTHSDIIDATTDTPTRTHQTEHSTTKEQLPEDQDDWDGWDDDQWYQDDQDEYYEEKLFKQEGEEESRGSDDAEGVVSAGNDHSGEHDRALGLGEGLQEEESLDETSEDDSGDSEDSGDERTAAATTAASSATAQTTQKEPQATQQPQQQHPTQKTTTQKRKKKVRPPRVWESNAEAVMKVVDLDAYPEFRVDENGKKMKEVVKKAKGASESATDGDGTAAKTATATSTTDAASSSLLATNTNEEEDDSSDDEEEDSSDDDPPQTTYLTLPNLSTLTPSDAAAQVLSTASTGMSHPLHKRLTEIYSKATSHSCRAKIAEHYALFINGFAAETKFPFEDFYYPNTCKAIPRYGDWDNLPEGVNVQEVQYRVYQPEKDSVPEGTYLENVDELELCYVILTHDQPEATIRLIQSLYVEDVTTFAIHVDGKEKSDATYERLVNYAKEMNEYAVDVEGKKEYIRIVPNKNRVRVNWGGYTMVEATLVALKTAFGLDYYHDHPKEKGGKYHDNPHAFRFHKLVHIASTTYPLASNTEIRDTLVSYPLDANFLHIILKPNNPAPSVWNYFVECDDALHRIYRLPALNFERGNGVDIYTSSQWFIISRDFAWYLASPPKDR